MLLQKLKHWLFVLGNWCFPKKNPNQNIGLEGDLDDVEILEHLEKRFSIKISDLEANETKNMGDLYANVSTKSAGNGVDVSWEEFLDAIEAYSRLPTSEIKKETEFFRYIQRWKN